jgi:hypothetical protein
VRFATPALAEASSLACADVITDIRGGPDGKLYQLGSSPATGVEISRFSLGATGEARP